MNKINLWRWDYFSDQPYQISKKYKKQLRAGRKFEIFSSHLIGMFKLIKNLIFKKEQNDNLIDLNDFLAIVVSLERGENKQLEILKNLNIKNISLRFHLDNFDEVDKYINFAREILKINNNHEIVLTILQNREDIENLNKFENEIKIIFDKFSEIGVNKFQIGNVPNRIKWGFVSPNEYLNFYNIAFNVRNEFFKNIELIGSSVIDFEIHWWASTFLAKEKYDFISSLLYVDRRGYPENKQGYFFNLDKKIWLLHKIFSPKKIFITETNYPIRDTFPYTPTSQTETILLKDYSAHMIRYLAIAISTKKIHRVYWHQLIANGYGLTGEQENYPQLTAFRIFANLIKNEKYISRDFSTNLHRVEFEKFIIYWNISNEIEKIYFEENRRIMKLDGTENILKHLEINHEPVYIFK